LDEICLDYTLNLQKERKKKPQQTKKTKREEHLSLKRAMQLNMGFC